MKSSRAKLIALVSALFATSSCIADDDINSVVNLVAETGKSNSEIQSIGVDYFDSNWALFNDNNRATAPVDPLAEVSASYFDANWALFNNESQPYPTTVTTFRSGSLSGS